MSEILPLFPLQLVAYPGERIPLHIFEDRYQQLIQDCEELDITFGIPAVVDDQLKYGTEIKLDSVVNRYENGASDIICVAGRVFKIDDFINPLEDKLYAGGRVTWISDIDDGTEAQRNLLFQLINKLYDLIDTDLPKDIDTVTNSYQYAHRIGMSIKQEHDLLGLTSEQERLQFMIDHIREIIPVLDEVNRTKSIIQMNGHFRNYDPLDFKDFSV
ncbi:LON peptidase substrate-binding domain-containing protein [Spongiivirga citrea]|uniref:ATP-dependent protease n=1 Tax=Spongiivirga citrea TaxID=1481457 RepID=A0A6M0CGE9_9FLAO|nr:LON peptidase substrate-binding domain-containing protein [Spongiivirga citrea]NER15973.1 ATP-dependent protease [Spongiivirga citrea]